MTQPLLEPPEATNSDIPIVVVGSEFVTPAVHDSTTQAAEIE